MRRDGPWAAISCGLFRHRKVLRCTPNARLLYIASILYCADELTDGTIPREALPHLLLDAGAKKRHVTELVDNHLWTVENPVDNQRGPWQIHDYFDWNPSKSYWQDRRERERVKKQQTRANMRKTTLHTHPMSPGDTPRESTLSDVRKELNPNSALRDAAVENPHRPNTNGSTNPDLTNAGAIRHSGFGMANPAPVERQPEQLGDGLETMMAQLRGDAA